MDDLLRGLVSIYLIVSILLFVIVIWIFYITRVKYLRTKSFIKNYLTRKKSKQIEYIIIKRFRKK